MPSRSIAFFCLTLAVIGLAGCAGRKTKPAAGGHALSAKSHQRQAIARGGAERSHVKLPDKTGIPACDDYLASYKACHRAAHIFPKGTLEKHYREMRTSLLRQSMNPKIRKILPARCRSLAKLMRDVLHGKSCNAHPTADQSNSR